MLATEKDKATRQVVGYVADEIKEEILQMKAANRRLSESQIVEEAFMIALPELRQRHLRPTHGGTPGRRRSAA